MAKMVFKLNFSLADVTINRCYKVSYLTSPGNA